MPSSLYGVRRQAAVTVLSLSMIGAAASVCAQAPVRVRLDTETVLNGVGVACTGIGQTKDQARWGSYPIRVEFANATQDYMAGEIVTVSDEKGAALMTVACAGPWLLLKPPTAGAYRVDARLTQQDNAPRSATVRSPEHGQTRFILTFPNGR